MSSGRNSLARVGPAALALAFAMTLTGPREAAAYPHQGPWPEFADYEHEGHCPELVTAATAPAALESWTQDRLDLLYACLKAGPVPDGFMHGDVLFAAGGGFESFADYANKLGVPVTKGVFETLAEALWKGKQFYKTDHALLNKIGPNTPAILGNLLKGQMRFPAKVYCGQSLLDSRRESIIVDYAYSHEVVIAGKKPFLDKIDWLVGGRTPSGRLGLLVRDEIRMVRPGFYLGRAYMNRVFVLNFMLTSSTPAPGDDTCFDGYPPAL